LKLNALIVCDDIREELGGKLTLVGVYAGGLLLDKSIVFPSLMKSLCLFVRLSLDDNDPLPEKVTLRGSLNGEKLFEHTGTVNVANRSEPVTVRLAFVPFTLRAFGEMTFQFTFSAGADTIHSFAERMTIAANPA
jgi:hypothetical protein